jgi:hypothetical protein
MAIIDKQQLFIELSAAEPILVREATKAAEEVVFYPAIEEMKKDFEKHNVTSEIRGGITANNKSDTLSDIGTKQGRNLFSFLGFNDGENPIEAIQERLDPSHPDGPKLKYVRGSQVQNLTFQFKITAPDKEAIYTATPMPWATGLSWAEGIESGIAGVSNFLNKFNLKGSRSGGGIQVKSSLRSGRFYNQSYLSGIFKKFLGRFK